MNAKERQKINLMIITRKCLGNIIVRRIYTIRNVRIKRKFANKLCLLEGYDREVIRWLGYLERMSNKKNGKKVYM